MKRAFIGLKTMASGNQTVPSLRCSRLDLFPSTRYIRHPFVSYDVCCHVSFLPINDRTAITRSRIV